MEAIEGFSKRSVAEKTALLPLTEQSRNILQESTSHSGAINAVVNKLSENTIAQFPFPFGIAPNVLVNGKMHFLPLVTEESSVIAAMAKAAKFWAAHGGFHALVNGMEKKGQVHFFWKGSPELLMSKQEALFDFIQLRIRPLVKKMEKRGGGVSKIALLDKTSLLPDYFQLDASFDTRDAMGANFINTVLEEMAKALSQFVQCDLQLDASLFEVSMAILSNYTPQCKAIAWVECPISVIDAYGDSIGTPQLSRKLKQAGDIALVDVSRAVTHNKGIYNGVDALALATGNDWRAIEACGHAFAGVDGYYKALSSVCIENSLFTMTLELPLAVGTVGGVTQLHPMAKAAMEILENPNAEQLMQLMAVAGLASNFAALLALTSSGIQKGHMKMHLGNILATYNATPEQMEKATQHFADKTVSHHAVEEFLRNNR